jgi:hypothetical protein
MTPQSQGKPRIKCDVMVATIVSPKQGEKARSSTPRDNFFRATGSRPRPALVRITPSAMFLQSKHLLFINAKNAVAKKKKGTSKLQTI